MTTWCQFLLAQLQPSISTCTQAQATFNINKFTLSLSRHHSIFFIEIAFHSMQAQTHSMKKNIPQTCIQANDGQVCSFVAVAGTSRRRRIRQTLGATYHLHIRFWMRHANNSTSFPPPPSANGDSENTYVEDYGHNVATSTQEMWANPPTLPLHACEAHQEPGAIGSYLHNNSMCFNNSSNLSCISISSTFSIPSLCR